MNIYLLIALIVIGTLIVTYTLCGYLIFRLTFVSKNRTKLSEVEKLGPKWSLENNFETLEIQSEDNITLRARYIKHVNTKMIFIMFHGYSGGMDKDFGEIARVMYEKYSCDIILVSQRAHEISDSKLVTFGYKESSDVLSWSKYVSKYISNTLPIYLWGLSMGSHSILASLKYSHPNNVKGVIADCGYTRGDLIIKKVTRDILHLPSFTFAWIINVFCKLHGFSLYKNDTRNIINNTQIPILFVHGNKDSIVPYTMSEDNYYAKKNGYKDLLIVNNADHVVAFYRDTDNYLAAINKLLKQ